MLKASLFAAAAFTVVAVAAPPTYAQSDLGSRQIVVDPAVGAGGDGTGGGAGTGGGGGAGTGGGGGAGKKIPVVDAPAVVTPGNDAGGAAAAVAPADEGQGKAKVVADPPAGAEAPAADKADPLGAIIGDVPAGTVDPALKEKPADKAAIAAPKVEVETADALIIFLKSKGYKVDLHDREGDGDYVLVVSTETDKEFGYLLTVDDKGGKVLARQKIKLADYGYGAVEEYGHAAEPYDGGHDNSGGYEDNNAYEGGYEDNSGYGGKSSGSGY